jgi:uncharacterized protein
MHAVVDTNILVSAMLNPGGKCASVVRLALTPNADVDVHVSDVILTEYRTVLYRPGFGFPTERVAKLLGAIHTVAHHVYPAHHHIALPHPADLPFLEVAIAAQAVLVTGNTKHFPPDLCSGITVCTPAEFMELLSR